MTRGEKHHYHWAAYKPIPQNRDQRDVCGGHGVVAQVVCVDPFEGLAFAGLRCAFPFAAGEERHQQVEVVVAVAGEGERREAAFPSVDAEFFLQFADQGDFGRFACSTLPPGNSHSPAMDLPSGRWASRIRPSASISATAETRSVFTSGSPR